MNETCVGNQQIYSLSVILNFIIPVVRPIPLPPRHTPINDCDNPNDQHLFPILSIFQNLKLHLIYLNLVLLEALVTERKQNSEHQFKHFKNIFFPSSRTNNPAFMVNCCLLCANLQHYRWLIVYTTTYNQQSHFA